MPLHPGLDLILRNKPKPDALTIRMLGEVAAFCDYGKRNNVNMFIGELGWPNDVASTPKWNKAVRTVLEYTRKRKVPVMFWDTGMMRAGYRLGIWQPSSNFNQVSLRSATAPVAEEHLRKQQSIYGGVFMNTAGQNAVWGASANTSAGGGTDHYQYFSNVNRGVRFDGTNAGSATYAYDNLATFQYLYKRGVRTVTIGFRWERLQPTLGAAFDSGESNALVACVNNAISAGIRVIIQPFNKGAYYIDNGGSPSYGVRNRIAVDAGCTDAHFQDLWTRLSGLFKDEAGVIAYGLMNEPAVGNMTTWQNTCQAIVTMMRDTLSDNKHIKVPMLTWRHMADFAGAHPVPFITDSQNNFSYEGHIYFDSNGGTYDQTYEQALAEARSGYRVLDRYDVPDVSPIPSTRYGDVGREFPWAVSGIEIEGGRALPVTASGEHNRRHGAPDGVWEVFIAEWDTTTSGREFWVQFRMSATNNNEYWRFGISGTTWYLQKKVGASMTTVFSNITTSTVPQANNQLLRVMTIGRSIRCYVGETLVYETTDNHLQGVALAGTAHSNSPGTKIEWTGFKPMYPRF